MFSFPRDSTRTLPPRCAGTSPPKRGAGRKSPRTLSLCGSKRPHAPSMLPPRSLTPGTRENIKARLQNCHYARFVLENTHDSSLHNQTPSMRRLVSPHCFFFPFSANDRLKPGPALVRGLSDVAQSSLHNTRAPAIVCIRPVCSRLCTKPHGLVHHHVTLIHPTRRVDGSQNTGAPNVRVPRRV